MDPQKKKIMALFILVSFIFSSFAFAIISSLTGGSNDNSSGGTQLIYDQPLSGADEQKLISSGKVIVKVYIAADCEDCGPAKAEVLKLFSALGSRIVVEIIDTEIFPQEIEFNSIEKFPTIIVLGKGSVKAESVPPLAELVAAACEQFSSKPAACA